MMNAPTRKEFLASSVVCVIVEPHRSLLVFTQIFADNYWQTLVRGGLRGSLNDISTPLFGDAGRMKGGKPASNSACLSNVPVKCVCEVSLCVKCVCLCVCV